MKELATLVKGAGRSEKSIAENRELNIALRLALTYYSPPSESHVTAGHRGGNAIVASTSNLACCQSARARPSCCGEMYRQKCSIRLATSRGPTASIQHGSLDIIHAITCSGREAQSPARCCSDHTAFLFTPQSPPAPLPGRLYHCYH